MSGLVEVRNGPGCWLVARREAIRHYSRRRLGSLSEIVGSAREVAGRGVHVGAAGLRGAERSVAEHGWVFEVSFARGRGLLLSIVVGVFRHV